MTTDPARLLASSPVRPGDVVADKYRVERLLAAGGMGIVALARHVELGHEVALKLLLSSSGDSERATRFLREAKAAARIQSEHVARVFDCGRLADGTPYMVMEYLRGSDLRQLLKERGPLPVAEAVDLVMDALQGVAEAHTFGIVHRDLKPANLFCVDRRGRRTVKVLDFGISKSHLDGDTGDDITHADAILGSPRYMAPEQARSSKDVDARADIWSLGVVLYELLDGLSPFAGSSVGETMSKILNVDPVPLHALRPDVPEALGLVVARCLERDRERRYDSAAELARVLAPFGSERSRAAAAQVPEAAPSPATPMRAGLAETPIDATRSSWEHAAAPRVRRRGAALLLAGAVVGGAVSALIVIELVGVARPPIPAAPATSIDEPGDAARAEPAATTEPSRPDAAAEVAPSATGAPSRPAPPRPPRKHDVLETSD